MAQNTKIEWTDYTWNPVWGCGCSCFYCYAKKLAKRFGKQIAENEFRFTEEHNFLCSITSEEVVNFEPTFLKFRYYADFPKKAKRIFVNSMSDPAFWNYYWMQGIINRIRETPEITFQILTKFPEKIKQYKFPENVWLGYTITHRVDYEELLTFKKITSGKKFISFEPLLSDDHICEYISMDFFGINWVIIGSMTGNERRNCNIDFIRILIYKIIINYEIPVFVKQLDIDHKIVKDNLPKGLNFRDFPK